MIDLIDGSWLSNHLDDLHATIVDPRPRVKYLQGHVPGAINLPIAEVFDKETLALHPDDRLAEILGKVGISRDSAVVLYDSYDGQSAAMIAWLLEYLGHPRVMILSNYLEGWAKDGGKLLYRQVTSEPTMFNPTPSIQTRARLNEVLQRGDSKLLDLRSQDEFQGKVSTETRSGHISEAFNLPWTELIGKEFQFFASRREQKERVAARGINSSDRLITYCSNGPRAAIGYVALQQLGFKNVRVYDASLHEWAGRADLPLELGAIQSNAEAVSNRSLVSPCVVENLPGMSPAK